MRELTLAELELVAGGTDTWGTFELDGIDVAHPGGGGWDTSSDWFDGGNDGGGYDQGPPPPSDEDCRTVNDQIGPLQPGDQEALDQLRQQAIPATTNLLNSIPGGTVFTMPDGATVTIEHLRELWSRTDFEVLRGFNPGNGGPGEADLNGGNPVFRIDIDALQGYMAWPEGYTYYPLHELAHVTAAGNAYHVAGHGFAANEAYANALAFAIAAAAGLPFSAAYQAALPTSVQPGVTTTMGTGPTGTINPYSPCNA